MQNFKSGMISKIIWSSPHHLQMRNPRPRMKKGYIQFTQLLVGELGFESLSSGLTERDTSEWEDLIKYSINVSCLPLGLGQWFSNGAILFWVEYFQRFSVKTAGLKKGRGARAPPLASKAVLWRNFSRLKVVWKLLTSQSCCLGAVVNCNM